MDVEAPAGVEVMLDVEYCERCRDGEDVCEDGYADEAIMPGGAPAML